MITTKYRIAGFFWLMTFVTGSLALAGGGKTRVGIVVNLAAGLFYLAATVYVYDMLKPVNRNLSLLAAFFSLAGCAISGVSAALQLAQSTEVSRQSFYVIHVFFGLHCLLIGWLILRSTLLPRFVGALMLLAGLGWLTMSFSSLLAPRFGSSLYPFILMPGMIGELTLCLWLLIAGAKVEVAQ
jgi:hypothetical protein